MVCVMCVMCVSVCDVCGVCVCVVCVCVVFMCVCVWCVSAEIAFFPDNLEASSLMSKLCAKHVSVDTAQA